MPETTMDRLFARSDAFVADGRRRIIGLAGAPGSGKSTVAERLHARAPQCSIVVPMDGFHLANVELRRLGRSGRKGAQDTFDSAGYVTLLRRLREQGGETVYAPEFRREIEEPIAGAIAILPEHRLIITEGNYLLLDTGFWRDVRGLADEIWYVDIDRDVRLDRLIARHMQFGRDAAAARQWVAQTDEPNAVLIESTRSRADVVIQLDADGSC